MSLREQLLKAGLVTEEQTRKAESEVKKKSHKTKKDKHLAQEESTRRQVEQRRREQDQERRRQRDRELSQRREAEKRRQENRARAKQLIDSNRANDADAEVRFNFLADGRHIRSVRVTPQQQRLLAMGRLAILRNPGNKYDFPLVPRDVGLKLAELDSGLVLLLNPETDQVEDEWPDMDE